MKHHYYKYLTVPPEKILKLFFIIFLAHCKADRCLSQHKSLSTMATLTEKKDLKRRGGMTKNPLLSGSWMRRPRRLFYALKEK